MSKKIQTGTFHAELSDEEIIEVYAKVEYTRGVSRFSYEASLPGDDLDDPDTLEYYELFDAKTHKEVDLIGIPEKLISEIENQIWAKIYNEETDEYDERD